MTVSFILMLIACVIMLIVVIIQKRRFEKLSTKYHDLYHKGWNEYMGFGKVYRRNYKYMVIDNHDENTLNYTAGKYHDEGYDLDREKSTDHLLVFVKSEEIKDDMC